MCWCFPSIILCRAGFVERHCINLVLSWNILFSPSMVIESFVGYSQLVFMIFYDLYDICPGSSGFCSLWGEVRYSSDRSAFICYLTFLPLLLLILFLCFVHLVFWLLCDYYVVQTIWCSVGISNLLWPKHSFSFLSGMPA